MSKKTYRLITNGALLLGIASALLYSHNPDIAIGMALAAGFMSIGAYFLNRFSDGREVKTLAGHLDRRPNLIEPMNRGECPSCSAPFNIKVVSCVFNRALIECEACKTRYSVIPCSSPYTEVNTVPTNR